MSSAGAAPAVGLAPRTVLVHHRSGIGDLVWHLPYIRAAAAASRGGRITVLARPSCRAGDLLAAEPAVEEVIEYDYRPRDARPLAGRDASLASQLELARSLRQRAFGRMLVFSSRWRYAALGIAAGIPRRAGFGFGWLERRLLNEPPFIRPHAGPGSWVYAEATAFAMAHGLVAGPVRPRMTVAPAATGWAAQALAGLPSGPICALAIGSSARRKQWGALRFAALATRLAACGVVVLPIGGPAEQALAVDLLERVPNGLRTHVRPFTQPQLQRSAALLARCAICVGNDTGALNVAVAVGTPALGLFGATPPLTHDPDLHAVTGEGLDAIQVDTVLARLRSMLGERMPERERLGSLPERGRPCAA